jgi:CheY-like chemotaxis protein
MTSSMPKTSVALRTILLVEDEQELHDEMQRLLESLGYNVVLASNEQQSHELLSQSNLSLAAFLNLK